MDIDSLDRALKRFNPRMVAWAIRVARRIPRLRRRIQAMVRKEAEALMVGLETSLKPYRGMVPSYASLPQRGVPRKTILSMMRRMCDYERGKWRRGFVSGAVYHGDDAHVEFLNKVYAMHSQANPLHADVWPSIAKYEADIVSMTARMLSGARGRGGLRHGDLRRHGEHPACDEDLSRLRPR